MFQIGNKFSFSKTYFIYLLVFSAFLCTSFAYLYKIRAPYQFGLGEGHCSNVASTTVYARNWFRDGPASLKFGLFEDPNSIEFRSWRDRHFYSSYPPGTIIPIHLIAKATGSEPSVNFIKHYNQWSQFVIGLILGLTAFFTLASLKLPPWTSCIYSILATALYFLSPGMVFWHQQVYWSDQAVLVYLALFFLFEFLIDAYDSKLAKKLQPVVVFFGLFTDWVFLTLIALVLFKRITQSKKPLHLKSLARELAPIYVPAMIAIVLFILQITALERWGALTERFLFRTGTSETGAFYNKMFYDVFFRSYLSLAFGFKTAAMVWISLISLSVMWIGLVFSKKLAPIKKQLLPIVALGWLIISTCVAHTYLLRNHSTIHDFTAQKFGIALSITIFTALPVSLLFLMGFLFPKFNKKTLIYLLPVLVGCFLLFRTHPTYKNLYHPIVPEYHEMEELLKNAKFDEVYFSPQIEVLYVGPFKMSYAMKRVYLVQSPAEIDGFMNERPWLTANVVLAFKEKIPENYISLVQGHEKETILNYILVRIPQEKVPSWREKIRKLNVLSAFK